MEVPLYHISGEKDYPWRSICIRKRTTMSVMAIMNLSSLSLLRWFAFRFLFCRGCCIYNCCCHRWQIVYKDSTKLFSFLLIRHILIDEWKRQRNREKKVSFIDIYLNLSLFSFVYPPLFVCLTAFPYVFTSSTHHPLLVTSSMLESEGK